MFIEVLLSLIGSVFASSGFAAIIFADDKWSSSYLFDESITIDPLSFYVTGSGDLYTVTFNSGQGRVYDSDDAVADHVELKRIASSQLIGLIDASQAGQKYILAIFDRQDTSLSRNILSSLFHLGASRVETELLFHNSYLLHGKVGPHAVRVQVDPAQKLAISNLDIIRVNRNKKLEVDDLSGLVASFARQEENCEIKDLETRFVGLKDNAFYFVFRHKATGSEWLRALSTVLRVWSVTGIPQSNALGGVSPHEPNHTIQYNWSVIQKVIENVFDFQRKGQTPIIVLDEASDIFCAKFQQQSILLPGNLILRFDKENILEVFKSTGVIIHRKQHIDNYTLPDKDESFVHNINIMGKNYLILSNKNGVNTIDVALAAHLALSQPVKDKVIAEYARLRPTVK